MKLLLSWVKAECILFNLMTMVLTVLSAQDIFHNHFAVYIKDGTSEEAQALADKHGFINQGQIGDLKGYFLFHHNSVHKRSASHSEDHHSLLQNEPKVEWFQQQTELKRTKRAVPTDPLFHNQWFITNGAVDGSDMNVAAAWKLGVTGKGVTVTILDDGIQHNHPDLKQNYDPLASTDINNNDDDPMPRDNGDNKHGTRCAGEVAAVAFNEYCGVGVAYNASIGGVRMLDGMVNDAVEARALSLNPQHIDIYSASWGPEDDGKTVDGPGPLAKKAFLNGILKGRNGLGSIFVWASGNGGRKSDNCNCDGYTNSPYTLSISSATQGGRKPWYLEECSSTLATTYSSGTPSHDASITTVDQDKRLRPDKICTSSHTGTSASAPIAAGMAALALEANPKLTWRDMQHIVLLTANPTPLLHEDGWSTNAVGKRFNHKFGYGLMDGGAMVDLAKRWSGIGARLTCKTEKLSPNLPIASSVTSTLPSDGCVGASNEIQYLEHVQCIISLRHSPRGSLHMVLVSPSGTRSSLLFPRPRDATGDGFNEWPFLSVHFWGEPVKGNWTLEVMDSKNNQKSNPKGVIKKWQLIFYGTYSLPKEAEEMYVYNRFPTTIHSVILDYNSDLSTNSSQDSAASSEDSKKCNQYGICDCKEQFFFGADRACHSCHGSCKTCYGPLANHCLTCRRPDKYYYVREMGQCTERCPEGFLVEKEQTQFLSCEVCPSNCKVCLSVDKCAKCNDELAEHKGKCLANCPHGFFKSKESGSCQKCHPLCETCVGPRPSQCSKCVRGYFYYQRSCVSSCPTGFTAKAGECVPCPHGCDKCSEDQVCQECAEKWVQNDDRCILKGSERCSKKGQYLNEELSKCQSCHKSCKSCFSGKDHGCLTCNGNHSLHIDTCVDECPAETYLEKRARECRHCPHACKRCSDYDACTSCHAGYYLQRNLLSKVLECVDSCGVGMYPDANATCQTCSANCKACTGPDSCISCRPSKLLTKGKCQTKCSDGYFLSTSYKKVRCLKCHPSCKTCSGSTHQHCTSCPPGAAYNKQSCLSCKSGQFFGNGTCRECHPRCKSCTGPSSSDCTSCSLPTMLDKWNKSCVPCCSLKHPSSDSFCCICDGLRCTRPSMLATLVKPHDMIPVRPGIQDTTFTVNVLFVVVLMLTIALVLYVSRRIWPFKARRPKILRTKFASNGGANGVHRNGNFGDVTYRQIPLTTYEDHGNDDDSETEEECERRRLIVGYKDQVLS